MDILETLAIDDTFDIIIDDSGYIVMDKEQYAVIDRVKFELSSNNNWYLDSMLGINWVNKYGNGLLQYKDSEESIVSALEKKIMTISGVREIKSITLNPVGERKLKIIIVIQTDNGNDITITNEVEKWD